MPLSKRSKIIIAILIILSLASVFFIMRALWKNDNPEIKSGDIGKARSIINEHNKEIQLCNDNLNRAYKLYEKAKSISENNSSFEDKEKRNEITNYINEAKENISKSDKCMASLMAKMTREVLEKNVDYSLFQREWKKYYSALIPESMKE